jgi:putative sterol carrier protein
MSVADIEAAFTSKLAQFSELGAKLKFDFGTDRLLVDGTQSPATISHDDGDADTTVVVSADDLTKIMNGQLDGTMAFMTGKLKVKGNTANAMKLASVLQ